MCFVKIHCKTGLRGWWRGGSETSRNEAAEFKKKVRHHTHSLNLLSKSRNTCWMEAQQKRRRVANLEAVIGGWFLKRDFRERRDRIMFVWYKNTPFLLRSALLLLHRVLVLMPGRGRRAGGRKDQWKRPMHLTLLTKIWNWETCQTPLTKFNGSIKRCRKDQFAGSGFTVVAPRIGETPF